MKSLLKLAFPLIIGLLATGCIPALTYTTDYITAEGFETEINALISDTESKDFPVDPEIYYILSRLYSNQRNPKINYAEAVKSLKEYIKLEPEEGKRDRVQDLLEFLTVKDSAGCIGDLRSAKRALKKKDLQLEDLQTEYDVMKDIIKKLGDIEEIYENRRRETR